MKRAAALSMAAILSVGGATLAVTSTAGAQTVPSTSSTTSTLDPTTPTTQAPGVVITDFSVTLAGLGDITLSVDPITREISNLVVTPLGGITVSDPLAVHHGIQLNFTLADGTVRSIVVEVEGHHGTVEIEIEDESDELDDDHGGDRPPSIDDRGESSEHRNDDHSRRGGDDTGPPSTLPAPAASSSDADDRSESESEDRQDSDSRSGRSGRSGSRD